MNLSGLKKLNAMKIKQIGVFFLSFKTTLWKMSLMTLTYKMLIFPIRSRTELNYPLVQNYGITL